VPGRNWLYRQSAIIGKLPTRSYEYGSGQRTQILGDAMTEFGHDPQRVTFAG